MKKSILFLLLIAAFSVGAQKYVPFPTENAEWNVHFRTSDGGLIITSKILNYVLQGDTVIDLKSYKKLYLKSFTNDGVLLKLKAAIREENKKIFMIDFSEWGYMSQVKSLSPSTKNCLKQSKQYQSYGKEYLMYDFNKNQIGDTLYRFNYGYGLITAIDSIKIGNSYRKRYKLNDVWGEKEYVIEGIGSVNQGLFGVITPLLACMTSFEWHFVSFSQNNECIYKSQDYKDCVTTARWDDSDYLKVGTQWYYDEKDAVFPYGLSDNYFSVKVTGETVVKGKNCKVMQHLRNKPMCFGYDQTVSIYQSNDTVYFYNTTSQKFSTLYVYNAQVGNSWVIEYPRINVLATIDSIRYKQSLGKIVKYVSYSMQYTDVPGTFTYNSSIIEGIGDIMYYFNSNIYWLPTCDESAVYTGLRCYVHPDYGTYHVPGALDCAYVTDVAELNQNSLKIKLNSSGVLTVEGIQTTESCTFELLDLKGSVILRTTITTSENTLNMSQYDKGLYLYRISANGVLLKAGKIVKN